MKKILIGTHNEGKFKEISFLLPKNIKKISPQSLKIRSPKETGKTFQANSRLKARYFKKYTTLPVISDDSGLCINALKGNPGIYSARWAKKYGSFYKSMLLILKRMKGIKNRSATFVCCLTIVLNKKTTVTVTGKIKGKISKKILGKNGFGYDPVFIPLTEKKTFGQMSKSKKILMDHRFLAFKKLRRRVKIF